MIWWKTVYDGPSSKVQRQIMAILHKEGIPYRCSSIGLLVRTERASYRVSVRAVDFALAILTLKKYRAHK